MRVNTCTVYQNLFQYLLEMFTQTNLHTCACSHGGLVLQGS